ncbi:MAG: tetratricopeptide repeat protein [Phycisphaerales bacterium]|nr:tetratricopeptide repeat protein [Phycisphaerales bacterium]
MTRREHWRVRGGWLALAAAGLIAGSAAPALGQLRPAQQSSRGEKTLKAPDLAEAVLRAMEAEYLSPAERADLRAFHGVWKAEDLSDVRRRAAAALAAGVFDDPSLSDPGAAPEDRAEGSLERGELAEVLPLLGEATSLRAARLRGEALERLGRFEEAKSTLSPALARLSAESLKDAAELTEGVRCLRVQARLTGRPADDYQRMLDLLRRAREDLGRLYWPAMLAEAELLYEKNNYPKAQEALEQVLSLNPAAARAWRLLGEMAVDSFGFDTGEQIAARLDRLADRFSREAARGSGAAEPAPGDERGSPHAAMIRARAWLRQNDPEFASAQLAPTLRRFPQRRESLALQAAVEALRFDEQRLESALSAFEALSPGSPDALFQAGDALSSARQYEWAARLLDRAIERQPNWPAPVVALGLMEMQNGRDDRARAALERAVKLDPFNTAAGNSLKLLNELAGYATVETPHFLIRHQPGPDGVLARDMKTLLEDIHARVAGAMEHSPARRTTLDLMPDHQTFAVRITGMPGIHTVAAATGPVIAMEAPRSGKRQLIGEYDWMRVIQHEYTHTVTLGRTNNRIPHWFTEAAAVWMERAPRDYQTWELLARALATNELFDLVKINTAFVRPEKPTDRSQAYAQGHWMYEFIVDRWGQQACLKLMDEYARGVREDQAMRTVLGIGGDEFLQAFRLWAADDLRKHGMLPSPSIEDLRLAETLKDPELLAAFDTALAEFARGVGVAVATGARSAPEFSPTLARVTDDLAALWLEQHPDHPDLLERAVIEAIRRNDNKPSGEMIPLLERYARARPVDPEPHRRLAQLRLEGETPAAAVPHLAFLDAREQGSAAYAIELARQHSALASGDPAGAADHLRAAGAAAERATQIAPFNAGFREIAAAAALQRRDFPAAERHILALTELEPQRPQHRQRLEAVRKLMAQGG